MSGMCTQKSFEVMVVDPDAAHASVGTSVATATGVSANGT